jgi:Cdc25 family phosphatase
MIFVQIGNFVIIDVREPEEISRDGKISRNVNIPSANFKDSEIAKNILLEHKDKDEIVVHCIKSQQRGPTCALALTQALERLKQEEGDTLKLPEM